MAGFLRTQFEYKHDFEWFAVLIVGESLAYAHAVLSGAHHGTSDALQSKALSSCGNSRVLLQPP